MDDERDDDNFSEPDTDQNLVVQGAANNGKKRLRRRASEEQGARVFSHQLRGMSESDKHVKKIDDMTLWDRIMKDKRMARSEKRHLGSSYYKGLAHMYGSMNTGGAELTMTDTDRSFSIRPRLLKAIRAASMPNTTLRSRQDLLDWLRDESQDMPNPRELIGVLRSCMSVRPDCNPVACNLILDAAAWCARHNLQARFPVQVGAIKGQVDLALTCMAGSMRVEQGAGIDRLLRLYRDQLALVLSLDDVDVVKAAKGETSGCFDELRRLAGAGRIGEKIWGKAFRQLNVHIF